MGGSGGSDSAARRLGPPARVSFAVRLKSSYIVAQASEKYHAAYMPEQSLRTFELRRRFHR